MRPLLGRVPVAGRRNMLQYTEALDNAWWEKIGTTISDLGNGEFELTANAGEGSKRLQASEPTFPDDPEDACWSVEVQYVNWPRVTLLGVGGSPSSGNQSGATFNLETGEVVYESSGVVTTMTLLPDGWYRISMQGGDNDFRRRRRLIMLDGNFAFASGNQNWTADGTEKVRVRRPQFERAEAPTPYQRVGNALDVTEDGFPSPAFIRFDLSDDVLPTAFPDGGTFDVMLFGRQGSWIERGVTIAPAGSLDIGPTTITDGPAGLLAALGDIVGWTAVDRTLSGAEVSRLVKYHKARGAGDLLESIE
ncbi:MAG: hypothetical protein JJU42_03625 [Rhodobacteraceae bacterium]|nr:hypothetical protein [Paracoccaceae bacterium]